MKNRLKLAAGVIFLLAVGSAHAGFKITGSVLVDAANRHVIGNVMVTRGAPDTLSSIGCYLVGFSSGSTIALCVARNSAGVLGVRSSSAPSVIEAVGNSGPNSYYDYQWDESSMCTTVQVNNSSYSGPLQP